MRVECKGTLADNATRARTQRTSLHMGPSRTLQGRSQPTKTHPYRSATRYMRGHALQPTCFSRSVVAHCHGARDTRHVHGARHMLRIEDLKPAYCPGGKSSVPCIEDDCEWQMAELLKDVAAYCDVLKSDIEHSLQNQAAQKSLQATQMTIIEKGFKTVIEDLNIGQQYSKFRADVAKECDDFQKKKKKDNDEILSALKEQETNQQSKLENARHATSTLKRSAKDGHQDGFLH